MTALETTSVEQRRAAVAAEALSWLRTPYHHGQGVKGVGVDCAMLLVRTYAACGLVPPELDPRPYAFDWHLHRSDEVFLGWLQRHGRELPAEGPGAAGDVQVWRYGRCYSHGAVLLGDGRMVHALRALGQVTLGRLDEADLAGRPAKRFRVHGLAGGGQG
ncbi:MAG TPA: NlpC/P60 family protein [Rubrivivax sp.]|nr:NlpC/P60 family protein [Rubrivivax sp.]